MVDDRLLRLFDQNLHEAAQKCERLRNRLVFYFKHQQIEAPEDAAQEVLLRLHVGAPTEIATSEDLARLAFGFARNLVHEYRRQDRKDNRFDPLPDNIDRFKPARSRMPDPQEQLLVEEQAEFFEGCLRELSESDRELILWWYERERSSHKEFTEFVGISANALRLRVFQIRKRLRECLKRKSRQSGNLK